MKKILILISLVCGLANAATIATSPNNSGGQMILTDIKCKKSGFVAYTTVPNGKTGFGCYFWDDNYIHVEWDEAGVMSYPYSSWTFKAKTTY
jgi:hypothetical protein